LTAQHRTNEGEITNCTRTRKNIKMKTLPVMLLLVFSTSLIHGAPKSFKENWKEEDGFLEDGDVEPAINNYRAGEVFDDEEADEDGEEFLDENSKNPRPCWWITHTCPWAG
uniref:Uncharacterized protein n=1 Tax=Clytia hemisphaerica TaxID=252671 RepID=A0A7M5VCL7_9CNID